EHASEGFRLFKDVASSLLLQRHQPPLKFPPKPHSTSSFFASSAQLHHWVSLRRTGK
ncbi:hypothetical protein BJ165DRAFT_1493811, partial [Panaeolus papilionaceus]